MNTERSREDVGSYGDWLRVARQRSRLSQEELADQAGLSVRTVRNLESGSVRTPHPSSVRRLHTALGMGAGDAPTPSTMPADIGDFVGRERDLRLISQALLTDRPGLAILGLFGEPGVGKTVLAVHAAHQLREDFSGGHLYLNLGAQDERPVPPFAALGRLLSALGVDRPGMPESESSRAELFRQLVTDRRMLFVLDDVVDAAQVRPLLPGTARSAVVLVSRRRLAELEGVRHRAVERFSVAEAVLLLERMLGTERVAAEKEPAQLLVERCDYLPLAVRIAGAKLTGRPHRSLGWLAAQLDRTRGRLDTLTSGELAVRTTLMSAYQALDDATRLALRVLAELTTATCAAGTVAAALDIPVDRATDLLDRLAEASLLQPPARDDAGQDRYQIHDLVREFAVERVEVEDPPAEVRRRIGRAVAVGWSRVAAATVHLDDEAADGVERVR